MQSWNREEHSIRQDTGEALKNDVGNGPANGWVKRYLPERIKGRIAAKNERKSEGGRGEEAGKPPEKKPRGSTVKKFAEKVLAMEPFPVLHIAEMGTSVQPKERIKLVQGGAGV